MALAVKHGKYPPENHVFVWRKNYVLISSLQFAYRMMWAAGFLASLGSITYPAISAFVSIHSNADTQGMLIASDKQLINKYGIVLFCGRYENNHNLNMIRRVKSMKSPP